jgi:RNA polymerase sigma factor (sigma-70 family)
MPGATVSTRAPLRPFRSKRLLALASDDRLAEQIRRGDESAFEVAFERHGGAILGFCRHMLGSHEEAEDATQHTFAAAFGDLQGSGQREIALKPWLYTIARNRCLSVLRSRREHAAELAELPTGGLHEQVERRAELRELLADLHELPEEQRAALLLAEAADLSHAEVAEVLGCEVARVKALVFRARSGLIERRDARATPCAEIREQLANLRGGSLRRSELRHHLRRCPGCSEYREQVRRQRQMLAVALPVVPTAGLKSGVLAAAGVGGGAAGGGAAAAAGAGAGAAGIGGAAAAAGGAAGSAAIAKVALVGVLAGSGLVAGDAVVGRTAGPDSAAPPAAVAPTAQEGEAARPGTGSEHGLAGGARGRARSERGPAGERGSLGAERGKRMSAERSHGRRGAERRAARSRGRGSAGAKAKAVPPGQARAGAGRTSGQEKRAQQPQASEPRGHARTQSDPAPAPKAPELAPAAKAPPGQLPKPPPPGQVKQSK